jgi:hypothetical protein
MKAQIVAYVVLIFVAPILSLLHQNNIGVTYAGASNFRIELVRFVPLYSVVMFKSIITVTEASFISTPIHIVDGIRSIHKLQGELVSLKIYLER